MKKISILIYISLLAIIMLDTHPLSAQHQNDIWYFGSNAGMDFNSGSAVNLNNGQIYTTEGSAVISDNAGNLLFYTDGVTVWNKLHTVMTNGTGLHGGTSSTQSALIIPQPGSNFIYYIFTTGEAFSFGLQYSIVDMSLQSGNGEVTVKNIPLVNTTAEKVTGFLHANNTDYWVVTHEINNNRFDAFLLNSSGVNTAAVVSNVGSMQFSPLGYMKSSHKGLKLAVADQGDNFFELFDFDRQTGVISNTIHINPPVSQFGPYGVEFSASDSLLYGTVYTPGIIIQWDISSNNDVMINDSRILLDTSSNSFPTAMQLAPDGKIYVARFVDPFLGVINNPEVYGPGCDYVDEGFNLSPKQSQLGLPNFLPNLFHQSPFPVFSSDTGICQKFCIDFFDLSLNDPTSWEWIFPGGSPSISNDQNPVQVCYNSAGMYDVTLIASNSFGSDTLTMSNYLTVHSTPPIPTISQNGYTLTSSAAFSYQWQLNSVDIPGATNQSYDVPVSGVYTVVITDQNGCFSSANHEVLISGIHDDTTGGDFQIFPVLSDGNFYVECLNHFLPGESIVQVFNTLGQVVYSSALRNGNNYRMQNLDLTYLTQGTYIITIKTEETAVQKKVLIVK